MVESKNILDRKGFIAYWVKYMRKRTDQQWSSEQNVLINSVLKSCRQPSREEYEKRRKENEKNI